MMVRFAVIRHAPTDWNAIGRVQGRSDIPLSVEGRNRAAAWRLPAELGGFRAIASPLSRAVETAELLLDRPVATDRRLVEMDWAGWDGRSLEDLRAEIGDLRAAWETEGLDFRAPGGESARDVQIRLASLLIEIADQGQPTLAVTHRGVIQALYALATGWDMTGEPPERLRDDCIHIFHLSAEGGPSIGILNLPIDDA